MGPAAQRRGLSGRETGSAIGAVFGLLYVESNANAIAHLWSLMVRIAGGASFALCLVALCWGLRHTRATPSAQARLVGAGYWFVVAGEAAALFTGWYALNGPLGRPDAALPWVTLVVGVHFLALAVVFGVRVQHLLGLLLTGCGAVGMALALSGAPSSSVAVAAGIGPGFVLLGFSVWGLVGPGRETATGSGPLTQRGSDNKVREGQRHTAAFQGPRPPSPPRRRPAHQGWANTTVRRVRAG